LTIEVSVHSTAMWNKLKVNHSLEIPPHAQHDLLFKTTPFGNGVWGLAGMLPLFSHVWISEKDPFFISSNDSAPKSKILGVGKQFFADVHSPLLLGGSQFMRNFSTVPIHEPRLEEVSIDGILKRTKFC
jgi:hypothetical protein